MENVPIMLEVAGGAFQVVAGVAGLFIVIHQARRSQRGTKRDRQD